MRDLLDVTLTEPLRILDAGGGQGQIALKLAQMGHHVTLTDISEEMIQEAQTRAAELKVEANIDFHQVAIQDLPELNLTKFDLVLCHAVFEWLADPKSALTILNEQLDSNGLLSLMFYNAHGQMLSNLIYGNFDYIDSGFNAKKVVKLNPQSALAPNEVQGWAEALGLNVISSSGVRFFHDYMRDREHWQTQIDKIIEYELKFSKQEPYSSIGRYKHFIFNKLGKG